MLVSALSFTKHPLIPPFTSPVLQALFDAHKSGKLRCNHNVCVVSSNKPDKQSVSSALRPKCCPCHRLSAAIHFTENLCTAFCHNSGHVQH